ncbi:hypothetical protein AMOR_49910 [Anaeromyxobacter oryzae]|uniref:DUF4136 domain-containing protein n=2 Tax=Anaeromyxobacter oryzae TaxID=2918170 RepID=A0ABM7X2H4_9BACT|nr:hypothetical protein AMOR_49910 [Anaeromyxobacter oryzae]
MRLVSFLAVLCLAGCAMPFRAKIEPARAAYEASRRDEIWGLAKSELERRGFEVTNVDRERGLLRTEKLVRPDRVPCGFVTCRYRDEVEVTVAPTGAASVRVQRELADPTTLIIYFAHWYPPAITQKETIAGVVAAQEEILKAITAPRR